jgi:hypothetical protein
VQSVSAAARAVVEANEMGVSGGGSLESKVKRLERRYRGTYSTG